jgi:hypothetical protein
MGATEEEEEEEEEEEDEDEGLLQYFKLLPTQLYTVSC